MKLNQDEEKVKALDEGVDAIKKLVGEERFNKEKFNGKTFPDRISSLVPKDKNKFNEQCLGLVQNIEKEAKSRNVAPEEILDNLDSLLQAFEYKEEPEVVAKGERSAMLRNKFITLARLPTGCYVVVEPEEASGQIEKPNPA